MHFTGSVAGVGGYYESTTLRCRGMAGACRVLYIYYDAKPRLLY